MNTKHFHTIRTLALGFAFALAGSANAQVDLTRIAFLGDSEGAGFSNNCLAKHVQVDSVGAIIARQAGADFQQPIIEEPGQGGCLVLTSLAPSFSAKPSTGVPSNLALARPYNNLSIGGCAIGDMLRAKRPADTRGGACGAFIDLVLRNPALNAGSMVDQAIALNPTFVILENVGNDYLGAVLTGTAIDGVTVTPLASFTADYNEALTKLKNRQARGIVFGVADVTNVPVATTIPPVVTSGGRVVLNPATGQPIPLLGPRGCPEGVPACPIPSTTLVTLNAAGFLPLGFGIPCAVAPTLPNCNKPLPDSSNPQAGTPGVLLYPEEITLLRTRAAQYNEAIRAAATASGYKFYDTNAFLTRLRTTGINVGGMNVNAAFLSGGAFSYDGFHLTSIGYALLADDLIQFINREFNASVPRPDLSTFLFQGNTTGIMAPPLPFLSPAEALSAASEIFNSETQKYLMNFIPAKAQELTLGENPTPVRRDGQSLETSDRPEDLSPVN